MQPRSPILHLCGGLALAASLALTLPGVRAAHAEPGQSVAPNASVEPEPAEGGSCRVGGPPVAKRAPITSRSSMERQLLEALSADEGDTVVLNTRGYGYHNYSRPSMPLQEMLDREAAAQRARRGGP